MDQPQVSYGEAKGRWLIAATVLGSGMAFLDSTVVNVALPALEKDLGGGLAGLQWTVDAYLLTLGAFLLLGGSLGDIYGRRKVFALGVAGFAVASGLCGLAPSIELLIGARALQGVAAAALVPGSLALLQSSFTPEDRSKAIGAWSGLSGVTTAIGPFLGGYLVDAVSWRWVFFINIPFAVAVLLISRTHVPESRDTEAAKVTDVPGATAAAVALAGILYGLIEGPSQGWLQPSIVGAFTVGAAAIPIFYVIERRSSHPMLPLGIFSSRQFTGANLTTLMVYGALSATLVFTVVELQQVLDYSALAAGSSLIPITVLLLLLSSRAGALAQRIGPRIPMTVGPLGAGLGILLLTRIGPGGSYVSDVLPGAVVFGLGLSLTVAPLTAAVLAAIEDRHAGVASGVNNAVARIAGLLAIAILPLAAGVSGVGQDAEAFTAAFRGVLRISAAMCAVGALNSWFTIRKLAATTSHPPANVDQPCEQEAETTA